MSTIIWYGAGKNLRDHEREFVEETGYPVCICDEDETKWGRSYIFEGDGRKCEIVSITYVMEEFSDYELWLTLAEHHLPDVYDYLIDVKGLEIKRVKLFACSNVRYGRWTECVLEG